MKILIATLMRRTGQTGVQSHISILIDGLQKSLNQVALATPFDVLKAFYVPVYAVRPLILRWIFPSLSVLWYRYGHYVFLWISINKQLSAGNIDVINAQCPVSAAAALSVRQWQKKNIPVVLTCHFNISQAAEFAEKGEIKLGGLVYRNIVTFENSILNKVDGVIYVSDYARKMIALSHDAQELPHEVIWNGIHLGIDEFDKKKKRQSLGISPESLVITMVGSLEARKNQLFLLDIVSRLLSTGKDPVLLLVGEGPDGGRLEEKIIHLHLQEHVKLLGYRRDVSEILSISEVYCHVAKEESFGIAVIEAMNSGVPVLAAPSGAIPEYMVDGENGYLIPATIDCVDEYVAKILKVTTETPERHKLIVRGKNFVEDKCSVDGMTEKYLEFYNRVQHS